MMKEIQHKLKSLRVVFVCVGLVALLGISVYAAHILLTRPPFVKEHKKEVHYSSVATHAPMAKMPTIKMNSTISRRNIAPTHYAAPATQTSSPTMPMTSTSMRLHETSSAKVQQIGGGGLGNTTTVYSTARSTSRGITYGAMAYSGSIYVPVTSNAITAVGAREAGDVSQQKMGAPRRAKWTDDGQLPDPNEDPIPDEIPTPVGDVAWPLMALLTIGWCVLIRRKRQQACK